LCSCSFPRRTRTRSAGSPTSSRSSASLVSLPLVPWFWAQALRAGFKFVEGAPNNWIPSIGAGYVLGIDGISFLLIMLTTLLGWISILSSWTAIENRVKEYYIWFLVLQTGMLGVFMALDFFLFFVFWEAMLVPMYLLIGIWGGPRKLYAAIKFFLYTLAGSVLMLLGILFLYFHHHTLTGVYTFSLPDLYATAPKIRPSGHAPSGCSSRSSSPSPSRCRCSRSTPGCPTRTWKRPPPARSSWPAFC
jgi:NADH:ubiquinone oxidoreductase subunit 4 (subunit M)